MPHTAFDPARQPQVVIAPASLHALRASLAVALGAAAAGVLQEAGYATGQAHAATLRDWLAASGEPAPAELPLPRFEERLGAFFTALGWGRLSLRAEGTISMVETSDWAEWQPREGGEPPAAHFTTGMLAGLFGALAEHPIAVLEVEPDQAAPGACRFAIGSEQVLNQLFDRLQQGETTADALEALAARTTE